MPILYVRALPQKVPSKIKIALQNTCVAIARSCGCPLEQVWATWEEIKPGLYTEGKKSADLQSDSTHPPIATLTCFEGKNSTQIEEVLMAASKALGDGLGIQDNIFITYQEVKSGEIIVGNKVIKRE